MTMSSYNKQTYERSKRHLVIGSLFLLIVCLFLFRSTTIRYLQNLSQNQLLTYLQITNQNIYNQDDEVLSNLEVNVVYDNNFQRQWTDSQISLRNLQYIRELYQTSNQYDKPTISSELGIYWAMLPIERSDGLTYYLQILPKEKVQFVNRLYLLLTCILLIGFTIYMVIYTRLIKQAYIVNLHDFKHLDSLMSSSSKKVELTPEFVDTTLQQAKKEVNNDQIARQQLTRLLNHLTLGVLLVDGDGHIQLYNPAAAEILGFEGSVENYTYGAAIKSVQLIEMIDQVVQTQKEMSSDIELFYPKARHIDVNMVPYQINHPKKTGALLVLLYDVTRIKELETVRTEFVANASHELRTPVTSIRGFGETLLEGAIEDSEITRQFVEIIVSESRRLEQIINDTLELSQIEKQTQQPVLSQVDLIDVVTNLFKLFEAKSRAKQIDLILKTNIEPLTIQGDRHRIEQILTNLIDNALNYSNQSGQVIVELCKVPEGVYLNVIDQGIGIPKDQQERIFERFYRVDKGRSRNSGGTGLGLSIVRHLVRLFDGRIQVESQLGEGSTFKVFLPNRKE